MFSGTRDYCISQREVIHRDISRKVAAEGMVLLKNEDHLLPLERGCKIALYGSGAGKTIKGGIGSGDVNEREVVSVEEGLQKKGFQITTKKWLDRYHQKYERMRAHWRDELLGQADTEALEDFFYTYAANPFRIPDTQGICEEDIRLSETDTAIYVISRRSGEAADRKAERGDYYLTVQEEKDIAVICSGYSQVVLIVNTGGIIDLSFVEQYPSLKSILYMSQAGMESGNAAADIIAGDISPCGKLTDTWAYDYWDYPSSATFSYNNRGTEKEYYHEGIYVGYRYFDTFGITPQYAFGHGLTYADMAVTPCETPVKCGGDGIISVYTEVKNNDLKFSGKEVVQVYVSLPQNNLEKESHRLCGFAKSPLLNPGEKVQLKVEFPYKELASFQEKEQAWILESGTYGIWLGNASDHLSLCAGILVDHDICLERVERICQITLNDRKNLKELRRNEEIADRHGEIQTDKVPLVRLAAMEIKPTETQSCNKNVEETGDISGKTLNKLSDAEKWFRKAQEYVDRMTTDEQIHMVVGEISRAQGNQESVVGNAGTLVPGTAGETSSQLMEKHGIAGVVMADGPAGLRIKKYYAVSKKNQKIIPDSPFAAFEGGYFVQAEIPKDADIYYQFCTSFPVGTLLAQTWDVALVREVGQAVGIEMAEFGINWWLAPGMNIHRNPLCGRNFEYYSEDPVLSGHMAASVVQGVQSNPELGAVIKHFACNNREENRNQSDSILSERALREIYLKGFEIAVKEAHPLAIMTSFNLINGEHAANSYDLCTTAARQEWGFEGLIMTDWFTTDESGGSHSWKCIAAGNDLIMPGTEKDIENIKEALEYGMLKENELKECAVRVLSNVLRCQKKQKRIKTDRNES